MGEENNAHPIPLFRYYECETNPIGKNFLLNTYGKDGFNEWIITENGGDKWEVEFPFAGCQPLPEEALLENGITLGEDVSCFVTSYGYCEKHQVIRLKDFGVSSKLMDELRPTVEVSEWYVSRFDCGSYYIMRVDLLNADFEMVHTKTFSDKLANSTEPWRKAVVVLKNYGEGVRFIRFEHGGRDIPYWAGHYGSKMTLPIVRLQMPNLPA